MYDVGVTHLKSAIVIRINIILFDGSVLNYSNTPNHCDFMLTSIVTSGWKTQVYLTQRLSAPKLSETNIVIWSNGNNRGGEVFSDCGTICSMPGQT